MKTDGKKFCYGCKQYINSSEFVEKRRCATCVVLRPSGTKLAYRKQLSPEKRKEYDREKNLWTYFGMTSDEYEAILKLQGGVCAICGMREKATDHFSGQPRPLAVDHNHQTGTVRGLLCFKCNAGIGMFNEDHRILVRASEYLLKYSGRQPRTLLYVNRHVVKANKKAVVKDPPISIRRGSNPVCRAHEVIFHGPGRVIYSPTKPLPCGAELWIETEYDVSEIRWAPGQTESPDIDCSVGISEDSSTSPA